jgi:aldose 1-epimerase
MGRETDSETIPRPPKTSPVRRSSRRGRQAGRRDTAWSTSIRISFRPASALVPPAAAAVVDREPGGSAVRPTGEQFEISHGDQRAWIVEAGGGIRSYQVGGHELLDGYPPHERCPDARGQPLIPWPNRLRHGRYRFDGAEHQLPLTEPEKQNAIHGLVRWSSWTVASGDSNRITMLHKLHAQDGYPFSLRIEIEYMLAAAGLTVRTTATNTGAGKCPFGAGAHPYITAGTPLIDSARLRSPAKLRLTTDEQGIPTGTAPVAGTEHDFLDPRPIGPTVLDAAYTDLEPGPDGRAVVELTAADGDPSVSLWLGDSYPYLMLFTGDSLPDPGRRRRSLGVEPMTCAPNALSSGDGLVILEPDERFTAEWGVTYRGPDRDERSAADVAPVPGR